MLPLVTIKMVKFSLEHSLSPMSAVGIAYFGCLVARLGDLRGGYRFTKLATALLNKFGNNEIAGEVVSLTAAIQTYIEPWQVVNEDLEKGIAVTMKAEDMHCARFRDYWD
ncbi:hypothetical protein ACHAWO_010976 [Cyclotella atomus]|uniref:Uncharacterized protein n=1 Tax=Cyclotella atomus TaxID=382360 RepID=A0ABD3N875_9STRA